MTSSSGARPEFDLEPGTRIIGDLHVDIEVGPAAATFVNYLDGLHGTPRLIILGDLFEYWFGPAQAEVGGGPELLDALARRVRSGTAIHLIPGNRDFLVDAEFERRTGVQIAPEGLVGRLPGGARLLAIHGDELCTLDKGYLRLRRILRSRAIRGFGRRLPGSLGHALSRRLRRATSRALAKKPAPETLQQPAAALKLAAEARADLLVCGHSHRYRDELLERPGGGPALRWLIVDAFGDPADTFEVSPGGEMLVDSSLKGGEEPGTEQLPAAAPGPILIPSKPEPSPQRTLIIAIDGPAGAGKSTVARMVAARLGLRFLDTGAMYRGVTLAVLERGIDPAAGAEIGALAAELRLDFDEHGLLHIDGVPAEPAIRSATVDANVSEVSAHASVRKTIVAEQQRLGRVLGGIVAEGRDTTTAVFPAADLKIFLAASPEERARRRAVQMGEPQLAGEVLTQILRRDALDMGRQHSPLTEAPDALRIDADHGTADEVAERIVSLAQERGLPSPPG